MNRATDSVRDPERRFAEELRDLGNDVAIVPRGQDKTPDFLINGISHELKTIANVSRTDSDGVSKAIASTIMDGRRQSPRVIIDARGQAGMSQEIAQRSIARALGRDSQTGSKIETITVLTKDGPIYFGRSK